MDCRIKEQLQVKVTLVPMQEGCLVQGHITGCVILPCDRCAEDAVVSLNTDFEVFESLLPETEEDGEEYPAEESHIRMEDGTPLLDLAALCWEEFVLALPVNPLCVQDCKGLCSHCGTNLNEGSCTCVNTEEDPRMAVLRNLSIRKK